MLIVRNLTKVLSKEELENWVVLTWSILNARNSLIHEGTNPKPYRIIDKCLGMLRDFHQAQEVTWVHFISKGS